ncbi:MAG: ATP-dependent DNA helicase, partial [Defluviitaleaceae bacterium]|nr:ATP-dependent DNA helicase [Defluviitaleaceae bacterium]
MITKISVHKIIDLILRSGDIDSRFADSSTMYKGAAAHRKIQKEAPEGYKKEVTLKLETEIEGIPTLIQGRADGIITAPDGTITIDEIKTTTLPLSYLYKQHQQHLGQGKCYAYMYISTLEAPPEAIAIQLTYYQLDSEELERHTWQFTPAEVEAFFLDLLHKYGMWLRLQRDWKIERDTSIQAAKFPFESFRKGQREFAAAAYRAVAAKKKLYAAAPTGIGKTLSALFPAIKAIGEGKAEKIFYLTAKTITRTVAEDAVKLMADKGLRFKSVTLRAKDKICPNSQRNCTPDHCANANGHYDRINDAVWDLINNNDLITPAITQEYAKKHRVCPHEYALDAALWCDLVIGDYNHVFDPSVYLRRFFNDNAVGDYVFLIDEAHNLADRVRDMYTASLRKNSFSNIRKQLKDKDPLSTEVRKTLRLINAYLGDIKKEHEKNHATQEQDMVFKAFITMFSKSAGEWLAAKKYDNHELYEEMLNLYFDVNMYTMISEIYGHHYTTLIETQGRDVAITLFCLDPSNVIAEGLSRGIASIIVSATLTPLGYYREILGGDTSDPIITLPSPFDP